jgi:putative ABC transport system permease protein
MFTRRRHKPTDFSAEIEVHIALEADRLRSEGLSDADAQAQARRTFGNALLAQERYYESRHSPWWDALSKDLLYAFRTLRRSPLFTAAAALTLALGIGANTALFTIIDAVLLRPLPYPDAGNLVKLYERPADGSKEAWSPADFLDFRRELGSFAYVAAYREGPLNITGRAQPQRVNGAVVTADFFAAMRVEPQIGRTFDPGRDKPGVPLAVLGDSLWRRQYGADPNIAGKTLDIDGQPRTIAGVMPAAFQFPAECEIWTLSRFAVPEYPLAPTIDRSHDRGGHYFDIVARLKSGVTIAHAQAESEAFARRLKRQYGNDEEAVGAAVVGLREDLVGQTKPALLLLLAAVTLLLLVACVNVANLLLARGAARQKEIAVRGALGAGRWRITRQLLTESVLLAGVGGAAGILLAYVGLMPLRAFIPAEMLSGAPLKMDLTVLAFTAGVSLAAGIFFGLFPALGLANRDLNGMLADSGRGFTGGARARRMQGALVVSEIALASVLIVGAGLLVRSFGHLLETEEGFNPDRLLSLRLSLSQASYPDPAKRALFVHRALEEIKGQPGVVSAGVTSRLPLNPGNSTRSLTIKGRARSASIDTTVDYSVVSPDYFSTLGATLLKGRAFTDRDDTAPVVLINEAAARRFWQGQDAVGAEVRTGACGQGEQWCQVVGVVSNIRQHNLATPATATLYVPYAKDPWPFMAFVVRTQTEPLRAASAVESAIHVVNRNQPVFQVRAMREVVSSSLSARRFRMLLLGLFSALALTLACIGIYGVMAYAVAERSSEIGIRVALCAQPAQILKLVMGSGLRLAVSGVALGAVLSFGLNRFLGSALYGVRPTDGVTFLAADALLMIVAVLASYVPARRAMSIDPVVALRTE